MFVNFLTLSYTPDLGIFILHLVVPQTYRFSLCFLIVTKCEIFSDFHDLYTKKSLLGVGVDFGAQIKIVLFNIQGLI
jgi:hypothetical protein